jgi:hypothetical protein
MFTECFYFIMCCWTVYHELNPVLIFGCRADICGLFVKLQGKAGSMKLVLLYVVYLWLPCFKQFAWSQFCRSIGWLFLLLLCLVAILLVYSWCVYTRHGLLQLPSAPTTPPELTVPEHLLCLPRRRWQRPFPGSSDEASDVQAPKQQRSRHRLDTVFQSISSLDCYICWCKLCPDVPDSIDSFAPLITD